MKILSAQQIHDWDAYTIANEPIASIDLMERAAQACTDHILQQDLFTRPFKIFCGKGNNGGDGLAIARQLLNQGATVSVYIIEFGAVGTEDFQTNLRRLHDLTVNIFFIQSQEFFPVIEDNDVVIDALYGSGLNRPLKDLSAELVDHINRSEALVIAIDVPSGMFIDKSSSGNAVIKASMTLTFQCLKMCFLLAENEGYMGNVHVLDIGLHPGFPENVSSCFQLLGSSIVKKIYRPRNAFAHKGNFGHALIIAGNKGKMGAALMATHACLRTGAGLTTLNVPEEFLHVVHTSLPEAMCDIREEGLNFEKINAVGLGPGLGIEREAEEIVHQTLLQFDRPVVIDADGLNILSDHKSWLKQVQEGSILTPHPKEFERVFGKADNDFERISVALQQSAENKFIIVLKGRYTFIAKDGKGFFNITGNAGLAKGGSGDILTGIITALLAQNYEPLHAALLGVYIHGLAADLALEQQSMESLIASDVLKYIGGAFNSL